MPSEWIVDGPHWIWWSKVGRKLLLKEKVERKDLFLIVSLKGKFNISVHLFRTGRCSSALPPSQTQEKGETFTLHFQVVFAVT